MSTFDPENFMNISTEEASDTQRIEVPEGEYPAAVVAIFPRTTNSGKALISVQWKVDSEEARDATGQAEPMVFQTVWLDVKEDGNLDMGRGKNVGLGKLREALGQNAPGKPWSPGMLIGGVAKIKVAHSIDKRDNVTINADVKAVVKL
jgi:hypothetical protein